MSEKIKPTPLTLFQNGTSKTFLGEYLKMKAGTLHKQPCFHLQHHNDVMQVAVNDTLPRNPSYLLHTSLPILKRATGVVPHLYVPLSDRPDELERN